MISFPQIGYMGRLGNQMFQFASTLGIANNLNSIARFPLENCLIHQSIGPFDPKTGSPIPVRIPSVISWVGAISKIFEPLKELLLAIRQVSTANPLQLVKPKALFELSNQKFLKLILLFPIADIL